MTLSFKIVKQGTIDFVEGAIDEHANFSKLLKNKPPIVLNLSRVTGINSIGIRIMLNFMRDLGNTPIEFYDVPSSVLDAINTIPGLLGSPAQVVRVRSVLIPYMCSHCKLENSVMVKINHSLKKAPALVPQPCPKCKKPSDPLINEDDAFLFLSVAH